MLALFCTFCHGNVFIEDETNPLIKDYDLGFLHVRDGGRNDGEPDYDPEYFQLRDGGRNDGEPDYDPGTLSVRSDEEDDVLLVPDSVWENEANQTHHRRFLMLFPEDYKGKYKTLPSSRDQYK